MTLTARQQSIKDEFIRTRNTWAPQWESILLMDCEFLNAYLKLSAVPLRHNHLPVKVKEFIYIALNASSTHLFAPGILVHLKAAIGFGASREELMEVLELVSTVGIHAANIGVPMLLEVVDKEGLGCIPTRADTRRAQARFHRGTGLLGCDMGSHADARSGFF